MLFSSWTKYKNTNVFAILKYSKSYKDKYIKMNCWAKMGEKFDISAADAEKNL